MTIHHRVHRPQVSGALGVKAPPLRIPCWAGGGEETQTAKEVVAARHKPLHTATDFLSRPTVESPGDHILLEFVPLPRAPQFPLLFRVIGVEDFSNLGFDTLQLYDDRSG